MSASLREGPVRGTWIDGSNACQDLIDIKSHANTVQCAEKADRMNYSFNI